MKKFLLAALVVVGMALPAMSAEPVVTKIELTKTEFTLTEQEQTVLDNVNAERVKRGLHPLVADPILTQRARNHAAWMASRRSMTHSRGAWENIAMGQRTPLAAFRAWLNSSGHRANMLSRNATKIGIGVSNYYWCQQFGSTNLAPTASIPTATANACSKEACGTVSCGTTNGRRGIFRGRLLQRRGRGCSSCG